MIGDGRSPNDFFGKLPYDKASLLLSISLCVVLAPNCLLLCVRSYEYPIYHSQFIHKPFTVHIAIYFNFEVVNAQAQTLMHNSGFRCILIPNDTTTNKAYSNATIYVPWVEMSLHRCNGCNGHIKLLYDHSCSYSLVVSSLITYFHFIFFSSQTLAQEGKTGCVKICRITSAARYNQLHETW